MSTILTCMRRTGDTFFKNAKVTQVSFPFVLNLEDLTVLLLKLMFITTEPADGRNNYSAKLLFYPC